MFCSAHLERRHFTHRFGIGPLCPRRETSRDRPETLRKNAAKFPTGETATWERPMVVREEIDRALEADGDAKFYDETLRLTRVKH
jgi:hypothetical protein